MFDFHWFASSHHIASRLAKAGWLALFMEKFSFMLDKLLGLVYIIVSQ